MEEVLDLYKQLYDPKRPLVCMDERPMQLLKETRVMLQMKLDKARLPVSIEATFWRLWLWRTHGDSFRRRRTW
jgi:hypothetical protein